MSEAQHYRDPSDPITEPWQRPVDTPSYVPTHSLAGRRLRDARDVERAMVVLAATHQLSASRVLYRSLIAAGALQVGWAA